MINAYTYIINNDTTVQPLLGKNVADDKWKVYPVVVPSTEKYPYITCSILSAPVVAKNCGRTYTVQVAVYHQSYDEVTELAEAVIGALEGQTGLINGVNVAFINYLDISDAFTKGEQDLFVKLITFEGISD